MLSDYCWISGILLGRDTAIFRSERQGSNRSFPSSRRRCKESRASTRTGMNPARYLMAPLWIAALATGAKSFRDNPVLGSERLNRRGLHARRAKLAHDMAWRRRARLAHLVN